MFSIYLDCAPFQSVSLYTPAYFFLQFINCLRMDSHAMTAELFVLVAFLILEGAYFWQAFTFYLTGEDMQLRGRRVY